MQIGDVVTFVDPVSVEHSALITAVHGRTWKKADGVEVKETVNLAFLSSDPDKRDPYGRQVERASSVVHTEATQAHGYYWK